MVKGNGHRLGIVSDAAGVRFDQKSLLASLGGWVGVVEAIVPTSLYVIIFTVTKNVLASALVAGSASFFFIVRQLFKRKSLPTAIAGAASVLIAVMLPLRQGGHASDYFVLGLLTNLGYLAAMALSIAIRFPIIGVLISGLTSKGFGWRKQKNQLRRFDAATALWVGLFGVRLAVEVPLFLTNSLEALGIVKLVMGVPLYAVTLWLTWLVVRPTFTTSQ